MPPSTTSIMSTLPLAKAGVGSAVNDTTREIGAALGVGIMGSLLASQYSASIREAIAGLPAQARELADAGVGRALQVAVQLDRPELAVQARAAFVDGMQVSLWVATGLLVAGAVAVNRAFPSQPQPHPQPPIVLAEPEVEGPGAVPAEVRA
jgi:DHA2 family multidrug resistance protein-like MFS transporter